MNDQRRPRVIGLFAPTDLRHDVPRLIRDACYLRDLGADVVELDTTPGSPFDGIDEDIVILIASGLASEGVEVAMTTTRARLAVAAADHGVATIIDPSGATADPEMAAALAELGANVALGPWSSADHPARYGAETEDAYTEGILRNVATLLDAGVRSEHLLVHVGAGLSAADEERWRMLNHLDRLGGLGYPLLMSGTDDILAAMVSDETDEHRMDDAATAIAVLAASADTWGLRTSRIGRSEAAIQRIVERPAERLSR